MSVTIADIAERANVSTGTVSNVLADRAVSEAKRQRVLDVMNDLDYRPRKRQRRSPAKAKGIDTIKMLIVGHTLQAVSRHPIYMQLLHGVERACEEGGLEFLLRSVPRAESQHDAAPKSNEGLIVFRRRDESFVPILPDGADRAVSIMKGRVPGLDHIDYDREAVARLATSWMLERGAERACVVSNPGTLRGERFVELMQEGGGSADWIVPQWLHRSAPDSLDGVIDAAALEADLKARLAEPASPQGIFCYSDELAMQTHQALTRLGVNVGGDVHLIGCNNDQPYRVGLHPDPPATIDIHLEAVGKSAVSMLLDRIQHPELPVRHLAIQPSLVR
jgi:DNA-binding LacI/PurR family transcriptional regulator